GSPQPPPSPPSAYTTLFRSPLGGGISRVRCYAHQGRAYREQPVGRGHSRGAHHLHRRGTRTGPAVFGTSSPTPTHLRVPRRRTRSEEHTSELQSRFELVCRL